MISSAPPAPAQRWAAIVPCGRRHLSVTDAMGEIVTGVGGVWGSGALVTVVLDCERRFALRPERRRGTGFIEFTQEPAARRATKCCMEGCWRSLRGGSVSTRYVWEKYGIQD